VNDQQLLALAETKSLHQQQREAKDERFRKVVVANPEMTVSDLAERFSVRPSEIGKWCERLGLPKPQRHEGVSTIARPDYWKRRQQRKAGR
jgi:hypothetical protein